MTGKIKFLFYKLSAITFGIILALGLMEIGVRIFAAQQLMLLRADIWIPDSKVSHRLAPNLNTTVNTGEREVRLITDKNGHRIGLKDQQAGEYRVLVIGDSFIEALQVEYEQTFPALLENMLTREMNKTVTFVSAGVSGWNPEHYLAKEKLELSRIDYDLVLIFLFTGNDFLEKRMNSIHPRVQYDSPKFRLLKNFNFQEFVDSMVYPMYTILRQHSHLIVFLKNRFLEVAVRSGFTKMHFPKVFLRSEVNSPMWDITNDVCRDIALVAEKLGIPIRLILLPTDYQVDQKLGK